MIVNCIIISDIFVMRAHVIGVANDWACMSHYILYICVCYEMPTCGSFCRHSLCCVCIFKYLIVNLNSLLLRGSGDDGI
jgi:hypothetical protein